MIDCLDRLKQDRSWTSEQRHDAVVQVQAALQGSKCPSRSIDIIIRRLRTIEGRWVQPDRRGSWALYRHGWDALLAEYQRVELLADPERIRNFKLRRGSPARKVTAEALAASHGQDPPLRSLRPRSRYQSATNFYLEARPPQINSSEASSKSLFSRSGGQETIPARLFDGLS